MPQLIEHIDAIARRKQRDVLYILFSEEHGGQPDSCDWRENISRKLIIEWLGANDYAWVQCGGRANVNVLHGYLGGIYVDTPFDNNDSAYKVLESFLENSDGTMRFSKMMFCAISLEIAMKNAHHDEPGFWEDWAENF